MNNNWVRLGILLSVLLLIAFPFVGFVPLTLLLFVAISGFVFQLVTILAARREAAGQSLTDVDD